MINYFWSRRGLFLFSDGGAEMVVKEAGFKKKTDPPNSRIIKIIMEFARDLKSGSVTLVLQDNQVVQINKHETYLLEVRL
jgi:hypothetical protein